MTVTKTTIQDIARELNITPSTVSRALNNHAAISEATKKAVTLTAKKLKYRPNKIASSLRLGKSRIIGVIIPSAEINFFGSVVHGIEKVASENDYNVIIYQSNEQLDFEQKGVETFLRSRVDGVLASIAKETTDLGHFAEIKKRGVPLVLFDRVNDELDVPSVVVDDYMGAFNATQHLIDQGCLSIAHIGGQQHVSIFKQRLNGYKDALKKNGMPLRKELIRYGKVTIESGTQLMKELLALPEPPDGVFAVEDFTALGALQALKAAHVSVPEQVALIGFANEAFGEYISPSLSTVNQQTIKMGEEAARLFFELSEHNGFYKKEPVKRVLEPVLIYRESSLKKTL
ncbi:MAG TPA: LacI family DNA-binding transcriptional regulator [Flavisolibacter sp.]|jgi:LacI family transcriptional regulator|nr:LacI family DNA-binding transcriptional regulator [Flavisolibacter sp.]